jgi:hypothetical protein
LAPISVDRNKLTEEEGLSAGIIRLMKRRKEIIIKRKEQKQHFKQTENKLMELLYNSFREHMGF